MIKTKIKRRRSGKEVESSKEPTHKESKSTSSLISASKNQPKSSGKSAHAEEHDQMDDDLEDQPHQEFNTGNNDDDFIYDKHAYWGTYHWGPKGLKFYGCASNMESKHDVYSRHKIITLYKFREGDFKRLHRQDIEDMLLLLVQDKMSNLNLEEWYALNVALRMFTRRIVIQERVEDLQLGVKSYQKKINLKRPDIYRSDLRRMTPYTAYPDIQGIVYEDEINENHLMHTDELHKFNDGTLNHVRTDLNDISTRIEMNYLPKRK
nr:hypothetical protein [Tanacetum cinerariifolium]